jgi:hypothetical protein
MVRAMRTPAKTRAVLVVAVAALAGVIAGSQAFGVVGGHRFSSMPSQARYGHVPNTLINHSISNCPAAGQTATVNLMQGTTSLASNSAVSDAKGKWAVTLSIPTGLKPGTYAVTAACFPVGGGTATLSYNPQTFKVTPPFCPSGTTTSTTVKCRVRPTTTTT